MKKIFFCLVLLIITVACGPTTEPALYNWGGRNSNDISPYEKTVYKQLKRDNPKDLCNLIAIYETMVKKPGGLRKMPPPGICAEYGYLLLLPETAKTFEQNATNKQRALFESTFAYSVFFPQYGLQLLQLEINIYPESAPFIEPLIKKFKGEQQ